MKEIKLTRGMATLVDDEDYAFLITHKWYTQKSGSNYYAARMAKRKVIFMHHVILGRKDGHDIDHIDHNSLNNQKENLRFATRSQNNANRINNTNGTSKYRGVWFKRDRVRWGACIGINGKTKYLGSFETELLAAEAYNKKAVEVFGEFINLAP